jgi:hypothetical protein
MVTRRLLFSRTETEQHHAVPTDRSGKLAVEPAEILLPPEIADRLLAGQS